MNKGINPLFFFSRKSIEKQLENQEENEFFLAPKHPIFGKKKRAQGGMVVGISLTLGSNFFFFFFLFCFLS